MSHFVQLLGSSSPRSPTGALLLDPTGGLRSPDPLAGPPPREPLHCKILGTPMMDTSVQKRTFISFDADDQFFTCCTRMC